MKHFTLLLLFLLFYILHTYTVEEYPLSHPGNFIVILQYASFQYLEDILMGGGYLLVAFGSYLSGLLITVTLKKYHFILFRGFLAPWQCPALSVGFFCDHPASVMWHSVGPRKHLTPESIKALYGLWRQGHCAALERALGSWQGRQLPPLCETLVGTLICHCWLTNTTAGTWRHSSGSGCETSELHSGEMLPAAIIMGLVYWRRRVWAMTPGLSPLRKSKNTEGGCRCWISLPLFMLHALIFWCRCLPLSPTWILWRCCFCCCTFECSAPLHLMVASFIIVSSSSPVKLQYFNKPLCSKSLQV